MTPHWSEERQVLLAPLSNSVPYAGLVPSVDPGSSVLIARTASKLLTRDMNLREVTCEPPSAAAPAKSQN
eukprot:156283-Amphidinium_carterae.1